MVVLGKLIGAHRRTLALAVEDGVIVRKDLGGRVDALYAALHHPLGER